MSIQTRIRLIKTTRTWRDWGMWVVEYRHGPGSWVRFGPVFHSKEEADQAFSHIQEGKARYRWVITKDHLGGEGDSRKNTAGPSGLNPYLKENRAHFSMYDDDDHCIYEGFIYGQYRGFEPLDDFGMADAGCTKIKINGEWL